MQERYIVTVDPGSAKIALSIAKVTGDNVQIIYYKEKPSDGVKHGDVLNPSKAGKVLKEVIREAEEELSMKINQVVVGLPRYCIRQETASAGFDRTNPNELVSRDEIDYLRAQALEEYPLNRADDMIYGSVTQSFASDDVIGREDDIEGTQSEKLSGNFKVFIGSRKEVKNIDIMLDLAGVARAQGIFQPIAVAKAVLRGNEMANGVALVEVGAGVTSLSVYQGGIMRYYSSIPFGGKSITTDIRLECAFGDHLAENVKLAFGACLPEKLQTMADKVLQINDEENGTYEHLSIKYLSEIITARSREIVRAILFLLQESGFADRLRCGLVITGGGANLTNFLNLFREESGYTVRLGLPIARRFTTEGCPGLGEAEAAVSVGLVLEGAADKYLNCTSEEGDENRQLFEDEAEEEAPAEAIEAETEAAEPAGEPQAEGEPAAEVAAVDAAVAGALDEINAGMQPAPAAEPMPEPAPVSAPAAEAPAENAEPTLFGDEEPAKPAKKQKEKRPAKEPKPAEKSKKPSGGLKFFFKKIEDRVTNVFEQGFDAALGDLYDNMEGK